MRRIIAITLVLFATFTLATSGSAADQQKKDPHAGFYWSKKHQASVFPFGGLSIRTANDGTQALDYQVLSVGHWYAASHHDRLLYLGLANALVILSRHADEPKFAASINIAPIGFQVFGPGTGDSELKNSSGMALYIQTEYARLMGLNGRVTHPNALVFRFSVVWR